MHAQGGACRLEQLASLLASSALISPIWARALAAQLQQGNAQQQAASLAEQQALQAALAQQGSAVQPIGMAAAAYQGAPAAGRPAAEHATFAFAQGNGCAPAPLSSPAHILLVRLASCSIEAHRHVPAGTGQDYS